MFRPVGWWFRSGCGVVAALIGRRCGWVGGDYITLDIYRLIFTSVGMEGGTLNGDGLAVLDVWKLGCPILFCQLGFGLEVGGISSRAFYGGGIGGGGG